jgi:hypothetical protein
MLGEIVIVIALAWLIYELGWGEGGPYKRY